MVVFRHSLWLYFDVRFPLLPPSLQYKHKLEAVTKPKARLGFVPPHKITNPLKLMAEQKVLVRA